MPMWSRSLCLMYSTSAPLVIRLIFSADACPATIICCTVGTLAGIWNPDFCVVFLGMAHVRHAAADRANHKPLV
jgi:hypothetical protein